MGLDGVELVMAIEEEFNIAIPDEDAEVMMTPRDVINYVLLKTGRPNPANRTHCATQRAFYRIRSALIRHCSLDRARIKPCTRLTRLFPFRKRKLLLRQILDEIGVNANPEMLRRSWLGWPSIVTVGGFVRRIVSTNPGLFGSASNEFSRAQIATKIRQICLEHLSIQPEMYREDAHFIRDFGVG